jgi:hypothetical protein
LKETWNEQVTERRRRTSNLLLDDHKKKRILEIEKGGELDGSVWRTCFGTGYGNVVMQTAEVMTHLQVIEMRIVRWNILLSFAHLLRSGV